MKKYYQLVTDAESGVAELSIYGDITSFPWLESDVSAYDLSQEIAGLDVERINVYINSYGGEVAEGLAIYNALKRHKARVKTVCDGFACSAASVVFMAGEERVMNSASLLMIHNAWTCAEGNAEELRKAAEDLEIISETAANVYRERVSIGDAELERLLAEETWIKPADALAMGFATVIQGQEKAKAPSQSARKLVFDLLTATAAPEPDPRPKPAPQPEEKTVSTFFDALCAGKRA